MMRLLQLISAWNSPLRPKTKRPLHRARLRVEALEERALLTFFTPIQIRHAYGFDRVAFEDAAHASVAGDGSGTTIAIVDAFDDPNIASDLAQFDSTYGLPDPPSFTKVNQRGGSVFPAANRGWSQEIALDVEYAHAMAPGAAILLVEADDASDSNLLDAVTYAANQPGVVAVSMGWGEHEFSNETLDDSRFLTPSGHSGVTFLASSGDSASQQYPASSPNVVAVGGTSLFLDGNGNYLSESGWRFSGGGISRYENQPAYQNGVVTQSDTQRTTPDVAFLADPNTGVMVYDSYGGHGSYHLGGTSLACPMMAGLTAIVDQGRSYLLGRSPYSGADFLSALYNLPQSDLNDIVTGSNGSAAGPGYDLVTGRGTPIVDRFVSGMIGAPVYDALTGELLITGGGRGSVDRITLSQSGGQLVIQVSAGTPLAGAGIPADQTFVFDSNQYSSLTLATGDGSTTVNVADSADKDTRTVSLSTSNLTGLSLGSINFGTRGVSVLDITGGDGNIAYTITGTPASQATTLNTGGGVDRVNVQAIGSPLTIVGGSRSDSLADSNSRNTFTLIGSNAGTLSGSTYTSDIVFSQIGSLIAGSGGDTFRFDDGASLTGNIIGGGRDTLDYRLYSSSVIVNLQTGFATGVGGSISGIVTVFGGSGTPGTGGVYNLLVGSGGDVLNGGSGRRNILVAGMSASILIAGDGEDLLLGGRTPYDTEPGLVAWQEIAAYWAGSDDYATRIANLTSGMGVPLLDATVVTGNGGNNVLSGNGALAFLYTDGFDNLSGFDSGSQQITIFP